MVYIFNLTHLLNTINFELNKNIQLCKIKILNTYCHLYNL